MSKEKNDKGRGSNDEGNQVDKIESFFEKSLLEFGKIEEALGSPSFAFLGFKPEDKERGLKGAYFDFSKKQAKSLGHKYRSYYNIDDCRKNISLFYGYNQRENHSILFSPISADFLYPAFRNLSEKQSLLLKEKYPPNIVIKTPKGYDFIYKISSAELEKEQVVDYFRRIDQEFDLRADKVFSFVHFPNFDISEREVLGVSTLETVNSVETLNMDEIKSIPKRRELSDPMNLWNHVFNKVVNNIKNPTNFDAVDFHVGAFLVREYQWSKKMVKDFMTITSVNVRSKDNAYLDALVDKVASVALNSKKNSKEKTIVNALEAVKENISLNRGKDKKDKDKGKEDLSISR